MQIHAIHISVYFNALKRLACNFFWAIEPKVSLMNFSLAIAYEY